MHHCKCRLFFLHNVGIEYIWRDIHRGEHSIKSWYVSLKAILEKPKPDAECTEEDVVNFSEAKRDPGVDKIRYLF